MGGHREWQRMCSHPCHLQSIQRYVAEFMVSEYEPGLHLDTFSVWTEFTVVTVRGNGTPRGMILVTRTGALEGEQRRETYGILE